MGGYLMAQATGTTERLASVAGHTDLPIVPADFNLLGATEAGDYLCGALNAKQCPQSGDPLWWVDLEGYLWMPGRVINATPSTSVPGSWFIEGTALAEFGLRHIVTAYHTDAGVQEVSTG